MAALVREARSSGRLLADLTESNPTRAGIFDAGALLAELGDPRGCSYEPESLGLGIARDAVVRYYAERGSSVSRERVVLSASTSESYAWLFKLLCDPGDEVLVPRPGYPLFSYLANLENVNLTQFRFRQEAGGWRLDRSDLEAAVGPKTRAIVLVNPANPTGAFISPEDRAFIVALARERGLALVVDEVFGDYAFDPQLRAEPPSFATEDAVLTFTLSGLSKVVGLPQVKLGWMVVSGPERDVREALARLEILADTYLSVGTPVQLALPAFLGAFRAQGDSIRQRTQANLDALDALLTADAASRVLRLEVEAGWYVTLRVEQERDFDVLEEMLLRDHGVLVQPGYFFDFDDRCHIVLSLLPRPEEFRAGVLAILRAMSPASSTAI